MSSVDLGVLDAERSLVPASSAVRSERLAAHTAPPSAVVNQIYALPTRTRRCVFGLGVGGRVVSGWVGFDRLV